MGGKKSRESQIRASVKYNKAHDYFGIRPDKETGAAIRQAAAAAGQSVQRYILNAVQSRMEYDAWKNARDFPGEVGPPNFLKWAGLAGMGRLAPYWQRLRGAHLPTPATEIAQRQE